VEGVTLSNKERAATSGRIAEINANQKLPTAASS
jgi:hypothetical protein